MYIRLVRNVAHNILELETLGNTWCLGLPGYSEATPVDYVIRAKPEVQRVVRTEELSWSISTTVFAKHVGRCTFSIMDL